MKTVQLQAHRGVSTDYPENTMRAFMGAIYQGYEIIELDPEVTADGKIVILHDGTLNRTGRRADGSVIREPLHIRDLTYEEALSFDFGLWFSQKYRGEKIPLLEDVLALAKEHDVLVKIDNKFQKFSESGKKELFRVARESGAKVAFTCYTLDAVERVLDEVPETGIHYDGPVTEENLIWLSKKVDREKLVVWLPYRCSLTSWVKVSFADEKLSELVRKYAKLGLWILSDYEERDDAVKRLKPDVIETTGGIKPIVRADWKLDVHMHSEHSHDSQASVASLCRAAKEKGLRAVCITDHSDFMGEDPVTHILKSVQDARAARKSYEGQMEVLAGVEIGEGFLKPELFQSLKERGNFDQIIGSIHLMGYFNPRRSCRKVNYEEMNEEEVAACLHQYFADILFFLEHGECDILGHLTYPLRYLVGNYKKEIELKDYEEDIRAIFAYLIRHGIALEVNTSCKGSGYDALLPEESLLKLYRDMGGYLLTMGSDAHTPERIYRYGEETVRILKELGFKNLYYFKNRYICQCSLEE